MGWLSNLFSSSSNETPAAANNLEGATLGTESRNGTQHYEEHEHIHEIKNLISAIDKRFRVNSDESYEKGREALPLKLGSINAWIPSMTVEEVRWHCNGGLDMDALWKQIGQTDEWDYFLDEDDIKSELGNLGLACLDYPEAEKNIEIESERLERETAERRTENWDRLKPELSKMTVDEIAKKLGESDRAVKGRLLRLKLSASDFDGTDQDFDSIKKYGNKVEALICPHCQTKGHVRRTNVTRTERTRMNSLLGAAAGIGTNTSKQVTQMYCENCQTKWDV